MPEVSRAYYTAKDSKAEIHEIKMAYTGYPAL
jgi:hypothetical protein